MHLKYGSFETSVSFIGLPLPITCASSSCTFSKVCGFLRSSAIAHSSVFDVVSVPAANESCKTYSYS
ncbi:hypothetical protein H5410_006618 [Solanum commersonii]|uniref:Uncharacterized protein n=1 Tax=Solanum commersonii TaxID=4109 RepID=A0A9J6AAB8_SOLCO|nr:hypothetical protein H5410_006618 [Solanum commersonii]